MHESDGKRRPTNPTMTEFEATHVVIEVLPDDHVSETHTESGGYRVDGINSDGESRQFHAQALNLNGFAFATSSMEIGEYRQTITIEQEIDGGYLNLEVEHEN